MKCEGEQAFDGPSHRLRFVFAPARRTTDALLVCFADTAAQPRFQYVDELASLDVARLHVLDDFGPYADDRGYPGSWYLGEARQLTFADDVSALVDHASTTLGLPTTGVITAGHGAGGFAALHLALRNGWRQAIAGFPHVRLARELNGDLAAVMAFVAGGTTASDRRWCDELLFEALMSAATIPRLDVLTGPTNHRRHVAALQTAGRRRDAPVNVQHVRTSGAVEAEERLFASFLIDAVGAATPVRRFRAQLGHDVQLHASPWSQAIETRLSCTSKGVRCFAPATSYQRDGVDAGLRFEVGPIALARIDLTLRRPQELDALTAIASDAAGHGLARWQWSFGAEPPSSGRTVLMLSADALVPFRCAVDGDLADATTLDLVARIKPGRSADFTVHDVHVTAPHELPTPARGLPLPPVDEVGYRRLKAHALARRLADEAAQRAFPRPALLAQLPPSRPNLKVACLLDRFSELGFRYEFDYVDFTPDDFRSVIECEQPDLLLVESIWRGKDETWNKLMVPDGSGRGPTEAVVELVAMCRARGIPTVFWNKEDSPNFEHFIGTATLFDYIFTTDESCIPRYRQIVGHDRIDVLPFAAQPVIHNPIGAPAQRPLDVAFLGTFYGRKHPARKRQMEMILDPARTFGVHIYSRVDPSGGYAFPEKYLPHLIATIGYEQVLEAYRIYKVLLNVNSVPNSNTMCARRVFEILACGGTVISGPSPAIDAILGAGLVHQPRSYGEAREIMADVLGNDAGRERTAVEALREVYRNHTYSDRVNQILGTVGVTAPRTSTTIAMVAHVIDPQRARAVVDLAVSQTHLPRELIMAVPDGADWVAEHAAAAGRAGIALVAMPMSIGPGDAVLLSAALGVAESAWLAVIATDALYGSNYLEDLLHAQAMSRADVVGKSAVYRVGSDRRSVQIVRQDEEYRFVDAVDPDTVLASRRAVELIPPRRGEDLDAWQRRCRDAELRIYASNRFNFAVADRGTVRDDDENEAASPHEISLQHVLA